MTESIDLSREHAVRLSLDSQMLLDTPDLPEGKEAVALTIERLGYIQIDTISVVQRAHHHTLWTRFPDYDPEMLHTLQAKDRRVFEFWGHAASYLPIKDYRYYLPRMRSFSDPKDKWAKQRLSKCGHLMDGILDRIRNEGPLGSKEFKSNPDAKPGQWWDWKPAKIALELLFWRGDLMVTERRNFHRIYDLTERVLPDHVDISMPDDSELGQFLVRRALSSYGIASGKEIVNHLHAASRETILNAIQDLVDEGIVVRVSIENEDRYYALSDTIHNSTLSSSAAPKVFLLSPFDNLIIQRDRTSRLFGFDYVLECYMPEIKRKHGYFVLPVLWGNRLVGRLDPKADRKKRIMIIRNLRFEPDFDLFDEFLMPFARKLVEFAAFNNCRKIEFNSVTPRTIGASLKQIVRKVEREKRDE